MKKTAVITGVGPGLGASLVWKFASEGYQVGLLARSLDYSQTLAAELEASGTKALALPTDIGDSQMVETSFSTIREELGGVDVLINHAGNAAWVEFAETVCRSLSPLVAGLRLRLVPLRSTGSARYGRKGEGGDSLHGSHLSDPWQSGCDCFF